MFSSVTVVASSDAEVELRLFCARCSTQTDLTVTTTTLVGPDDTGGDDDDDAVYIVRSPPYDVECGCTREMKNDGRIRTERVTRVPRALVFARAEFKDENGERHVLTLPPDAPKPTRGVKRVRCNRDWASFDVFTYTFDEAVFDDDARITDVVFRVRREDVLESADVLSFSRNGEKHSYEGVRFSFF